jgi:hypothetical protein
MRKHRCKHCRLFFHPDPRNARKQQFCSTPECRKGSKAASQQRWLKKPENQDYFRGPDNVRRVQEWRKTHPGYWRRKACPKQGPLQDLLSKNGEENPSVETTLGKEALQDLLSAQHLVLLGLIAHLTSSALQDEIVATARRLQQLGNDILRNPPQVKGASYDQKAPYLSSAPSSGAQAVQLGGSALGP